MNEVENKSFALEQIPQEEKRSCWAILSVLIAIGVDLSSVLLGAELAYAMPTSSAIFSVMLGSFLLAVIYTVCAFVGANTSLSASMITHYVFGIKGAKIFGLIIAISLLGWFGVQVGFFAENVQIVLYELFDISINITILNFVGGLLMASTAIIGYNAIEKLSLYSVPFLLILMLITTALAFNLNGAPVDSYTEQTMTIFDGASLCISILIVGAITAPDISRWSKNPKDCFISSFFGILFGNSFMIIVSILLVNTMGSDDIMSIFLALGLGIPSVLVLTLAQWTTNTSNVYSSALGVNVIFPQFNTKKLSVVLGVVGTALAVSGIYNYFIEFLCFLAVIIAPVGGVYTAEYFVVKDKLHNLENKKVDDFIMPSIIVWVIGSIFTYLATPNLDGVAIITVTTIAPLDGFMFAFILQIIVAKCMKGKIKE